MTDNLQQNKNKKINVFLAIILVIILLLFGAIILHNLNQEKPSKLLNTAKKSLENDDLQEYRLFLKEQVKKIKNKGLKLMVYRKLGKLNLAAKNYQQALETYKSAYEINPQNPEICTNLGLTLGQLGKYSQAIKYLEKAKKINPKIPQIYNNLGIIFIDKGKIPKAIENFKKAIEVDPEFYRAYTNLISVYVRTNKYKEAEYYIDKAIDNGISSSPDHKELIQEQLKNLTKLKEINQ